MVVAMYKENRRTDPEHIRVHRNSDGKMDVEGITNSYIKVISEGFDTLEEVERYLAQRSRTFGYSLVIKL
jgi:hypothetical protein